MANRSGGELAEHADGGLRHTRQIESFCASRFSLQVLQNGT
jgi:hypothetical protein